MQAGVLRFRHCGSVIYSASRGRCPLCGGALSFGLQDAPLALPVPFTDGHSATCCLLVAAQQGAAAFSELSDSELHVGVSNSKGVVFSYTESGVQRQQCGWEQSIAVPLVAPGNQSVSFRRRWDVLLEEFTCQDTWTPHRFEEQREFGSCCYGFALGFINQLLRSQGRQPISRERFTAQFLLPRIRTASRYLSICQHISRDGYYSTAE
ncbi:MKRN2 opposite strand, tandem duplicate 1 [Myripristis murdjan]|uniref:MKRN2 opposite strand, tandem duplicate 1 n=1 Tax=Myripristis murdjan TaxID=586833 RepID=A0A667YMG0_9TELE|nr:MKRN2 opposite strand protein-like [Myripristis murdjan]XP_029906888.1 MKRN2 opposite strand protein-like [Myripristis murdjan]XP_029906889.1 MKRN2 opposite strand protein-like [Myripristis murdjan]